MRIWRPGPLPSLVFLTQPHLGLVSISLCVCLLSRYLTLWPHGAHQAPLSTGFSRQEDWSGLPSPPPGDLAHRDRTQVSCIGRRFFTTPPPGNPEHLPSVTDFLWMDLTGTRSVIPALLKVPLPVASASKQSGKLDPEGCSDTPQFLSSALEQEVSSSELQGGSFPLPSSNLAYGALRQEEPWTQLHCWAANTSQGMGYVAPNQTRETKRPGFLTKTIWEEEPEPWSSALVWEAPGNRFLFILSYKVIFQTWFSWFLP